jgi:hypothetical protein
MRLSLHTHGMDERLINPADGAASSDQPRPGDEEAAEAIEETGGIAGVAGMDPAESATDSDEDGDNVETERPKPEV